MFDAGVDLVRVRRWNAERELARSVDEFERARGWSCSREGRAVRVAFIIIVINGRAG
ncbi:MAG: hypothetical protein QOD00_350 [Blastocatellia bacterium]|nr:hypothetical protein [Blastocatellia bacterium]